LGLIPEEKIAEIRDRTDIVQVIGEYVTLRRTGVNHKGLCPFHQEKSPSFNVNAQKQFFHCFGCGKSGDVYSFLTEVEGKSFVEVARDLGKRAGVELPEFEPRSAAAARAERDAESERARLVRLNDLVADWFRAQLAAPVGEKARAYVERRGIGEPVAATFRVGYAPAGWDALVRFLESKRVPHELAERAGLVKRRDGARLAAGAPPSKGSHFDVFVDRVMYALTSPMGEVIGFGGRVLGDGDQPKYKNSPETAIYKKGENLFGLHAAKHAIRKGGRALVVEGNFDVMTLHQQGIDFAVAPQGTAITDGQVRLLKRFAHEVVLMLDADPAGRAATKKVIHLFLEAELPCRIVQLRAQGGKKVDPDDLARTDLPRLQKLIASADDAVKFYFDQVAESEPTVAGKVNAVEECATLLREIRDPLARGIYTDQLAQLLKIDRGLVARAMRGGPSLSAGRPSSPPPAVVAAAPQRPLGAADAKLLALLAQHPQLIAHLPPDVAPAIGDTAARALVEGARARGSFDAKQVLADAAPEIRDAVAKALLSDEFVLDENRDPRPILEAIVEDLRLPNDRAALEAERKAALQRGDKERVQKLNARILSTRLQGETPR
jgi:DNA primase